MSANIDKKTIKQQNKTVVSDHASPKKMPKWGVVGLVLIAVSIIIAFSVAIYIHNRPAKVVLTPSEMAASGDYAGAIEKLQNQANTADTTAAKSDAYIQLSQIAASNNKPDQAVTYAKKAQSIKPTSQSAAQVGFAASESGDWELAAKSFEEAANLSPVPADGNEFADHYYYINMMNEAKSHL